MFASYPDQVLVVRHEADQPGSVSLKAGLRSKIRSQVEVLDEHHLVLRGKCPRHVVPEYVWQVPDDKAIVYADSLDGGGMRFEVHLQLLNERGSLAVEGEQLVVKGADHPGNLYAKYTSVNAQHPGGR